MQIANLPNPDEPCPTGQTLVACGWGNDGYNKTRSRDKLWCVIQECVELSECPCYPDGMIENITDEYALCATNQDDKNNSICGGDSGGPLMHTDKNGKTTL